MMYTVVNEPRTFRYKKDAVKCAQDTVENGASLAMIYPSDPLDQFQMILYLQHALDQVEKADKAQNIGNRCDNELKSIKNILLKIQSCIIDSIPEEIKCQ